MAYPHPPTLINPHIPMTPYTHIHPPPPPLPPYAIANGPTYYQPLSSSANSFQPSLATPYHPHHPQLLPGVPPHAPIAPQRTVNFTTVIPANNNNNTNTYQQSSQRVSPTSMQAQEMNIQALQQRVIEQQKHQQTPLAIQRQMNRLPAVDYTQSVLLIIIYIFFNITNI